MGTFCNKKICPNLCGSVFEELFFTARQEIYDIICAVDYFETQNKRSYDYVISGGGIPIPKVLLNDTLQYLCVGPKFMYKWLKTL